MKRYGIALIFSAVYFVVLTLTLSQYGLHEDSPFHFLRGQSYLQQLLTGKAEFNGPQRQSPVLFVPGQRVSTYKYNASETLMATLKPISVIESAPSVRSQFAAYQKYQGNRISFYAHNAWTSAIWDMPDNQGHPAVSDILMAATNRLFYGWLGILGDIEAYHIYVVCTVSIALFFFFLFVAEISGLLAAVIASVSWMLFPYLFAESHFNIKDPVELGWYTIAAVSCYFFVIRKLSLKWYAVFVLSTFLALGTKWNIVFLPIVLSIWLLAHQIDKKTRINLPWKKTVLLAAGALIVPVLLLVAAWPFLWSNPVYKLLNTAHFYTTLAVKDLRVEQPSFAALPFGLDARAILRILAMSPPGTLLLFVIGAVGIAIGKVRLKHKAGIFILGWIVVPLFRVIWQQAEILGSIRNFLEYLPAFFVLVGIGGALTIRWLSALVPIRYKTITLRGLVVVCCAVSLIPIVQTHPNENVYFNGIFGSLYGVKDTGLFAWETAYDNPYRQGVNWFNAHAPKGARLAHLDGTMFAISPIWLRDDIKIGSYFSGFAQKGEYIMSVYYPDAPQAFEYLYLRRFLNPVYEIRLHGVPVLQIWKNDKQYLKPGFSGGQPVETQSLRVDSTVMNGNHIWRLIFPRQLRVTRLVLSMTAVGCIGREQGLWSVVDGNTDQYLRTMRQIRSNTQVEFDFPALKGNAIHFWDVEGSSCFSDVRVDALYALPPN